MAHSSDLTSPDHVKPDLFTGEAPVESAHKTWAKVQKDLGYALGPNVHRSWTGRLHISAADSFTVALTAPTRFIASKIENNYADEIRRLWKKHDEVAPPRNITISRPASSRKVVTANSARTSRTLRESAALSCSIGVNRRSDVTSSPYAGRSKQGATIAAGSTVSPSALQAPAFERPLFDKSRHEIRREGTHSDRYTFDDFVVGGSNEFAVAVARQIASFDISDYNPVIIHGDNGMGKTHLVYAIENAIKASDTPRRVLKVSGEEFVSSFLASLRGSGRAAIDAFKARLRNVDLLLIDDAHFIMNKPSSQEELLHTLVTLIRDGHQVLLTMDRHPENMETLSPRLRSYLNSGLICKIGAADYDLRQRILDNLIHRRRRSGHPNLTIPKPARNLLAARVDATPRDLEGAFNQVVAQSDFLGTPITLERVQETLAESGYKSASRLTVDKIQRSVAKIFDISLDDMVSKRRARAVARPRQVAMYLCKSLTQRSLPDIGRRFGGRDHTTVMHAVKRIRELRENDAVLDGRISQLEKELKA